MYTLNLLKIKCKLLVIHQQIDDLKTTRTALKATKLQYSFHGVFKSSKRLIHQGCQLLLVRSIEESQSLVQLVWHWNCLSSLSLYSAWEKRMQKNCDCFRCRDHHHQKRRLRHRNWLPFSKRSWKRCHINKSVNKIWIKSSDSQIVPNISRGSQMVSQRTQILHWTSSEPDQCYHC